MKKTNGMKGLTLMGLAVMLTMGILGCKHPAGAETTAVSEVELNKKTLELTVGGAPEKLTAKVTPDNATNKAVTWETTNAKVAAVDKDGAVTAVGAGSAEITVTTVDGKKKAKCTVTVKAALPAGFVKVTGATITGIATDGINGPNNPVAENNSSYKGVFIKDRAVTLSSFAIAETELTFADWKKVYGWATGKNYDGTSYTYAKDAYKPAKSYAFKKGAGISDNHPVTNVSWKDAIVWCNAKTEMENKSTEQCVYLESETDSAVLTDATKGTVDNAYMDKAKKGFRLPTEAEWEYAARYQGSTAANAVKYGEMYLTKLNSMSGATRACGYKDYVLEKNETWDLLKDENKTVAAFNYYWGVTNPTTNTMDWIKFTGAEEKTGALEVKGGRKANGLGLYDMSGNVYEWCFDTYGAVTADAVSDPTGASAGSARVFRGGSCCSNARCCAVGYRRSHSSGSAGSTVGFRLACGL